MQVLMQDLAISTMKKLVPQASRKPKVLTTAPKLDPKKPAAPAKKPAAKA